MKRLLARFGYHHENAIQKRLLAAEQRGIELGYAVAKSIMLPDPRTIALIEQAIQTIEEKRVMH